MSGKAVHDLGETIGDCGIFQVALILAVTSTTMLSTWGMIFMAFGSYHPGWKCLDHDPNPPHFLNPEMETAAQNFAVSTMPSLTPKSAPEPKLNVTTSEWTLNCDLKSKCQNLTYNLESHTMMTHWDLTCSQTWIPSVIISIQMVGVLIGSYSGGQIGDRWGRKFGLYSYVALHGVSHLAAIFCVSWQMYVIAMFFVGISVGGILTLSYPYALEFVPEWWRGVLAAIPLWNIGITLFALTVYFVRDWKNMHILAAIISVLSFAPVIWTPESVRWLAVSGRVNRAKELVTKIATMNGRPCPDTRVIDELYQEEKTQMGGHEYTYLDLFRLRGIRGYTLKFGSVWIILAYSYYAISFSTKALFGDFYVNFLISSSMEIPGMLFVAPAANRLGRRIAALIFFFLATFCAMAVILLSFTASESMRDVSILVLAVVCKGMIASAWAVFTIYSSEMYPTVVRSLHSGFLQGVSRVGAIVSPYLIPNDPNTIYLLFLIIGGLVFVSFALTWTLPESKGRILQDRSWDFNEDTHVGGKMHVSVNDNEHDAVQNSV